MDPPELWSNIDENMEREDSMEGKPSGASRIFATLTGKTIKLFVFETAHTVDTLKEQIQDKENIPPRAQRWFFRGAELAGGVVLRNYGITSDSVLDVEVAGALA